MRSVLNGIVIGFVIIGVIWLILYIKDSTQSADPETLQAINSFAECQLAGFEISDTDDPRTCTTPNGQVFEEPEVGRPGIGI